MGAFVTLPVVITRSLKRPPQCRHVPAAGFDRNTTGMHWHIHKDGSHYFNEYREVGRRMPVAVAIGTDPATTYAATAPLPRESMKCSWPFHSPQAVPMVRCLTVDLKCLRS